MSEPIDRHRRLLRELIELSAPVPDSLSALADFDWDSDPLVELSVSDLVSVLDRYLDGELTREQLEAWADAVEGRDDIQPEPDAEEQLKQLLFEISTPDINFEITPAQASDWRRQLLAEP